MHLLHEAGFLTPSALHYVTNHGQVPMLSAARHTLTVNVNPKRTKCVPPHTHHYPGSTWVDVCACAGVRAW
jgi:hypothetical protein